MSEAARQPEPADEPMLQRMLWRVMPLITLCMALSTIDRSNIGFAKLTMAKDLGMSEAIFALGSSLFYLGYLLFEVPSGLAAHRYGARLWFARIMATWGLVTVLLAFARSAPSFYLLRFILGVAEAGLYPGAVYYITLWAPQARRAQALGLLTIGSALGNSFGALVAGPLLDLNGAMGLHGWQWIFLVTGAMPLIAAPVILALLADKPADAKFLSDAERGRLGQLLGPPAPEVTAGKLVRAVCDLRVLGHGLAYTALLTALYGVVYWAPSIIKTFGVTGTQNGLMVALPWAIDIVLLIILPKRVRSQRGVLWAIVVLGLLGAAAFASAGVIDSHVFRYGALLAGIPCISLLIAFYWTIPTRMFAGAQAAVAIAAISTLGNFGGMIGQNMMPAVAKLGGSASAALWAPCVCLGLIGLGALIALGRTRATLNPAQAVRS